MENIDNLNILVLDDEAEVRSALRRTLRGQNVFLADSAACAFEFLRNKPIDIVVSDHDMPDVRGIDFLQQVRILYPNITRVMLTGRATMDLAVRALNEGAAHRFLLKPWNRMDLLGILAIAQRALGPIPTKEPTAGP